MARLRCVLVLLAVPAFAPAQDPAEAARQERQVKDDTDRVVRRIGTMLRVLDYYQLDQAAEKQLLAEAGGTLQGLSKDQMAAVIERLDAAAATPDEGKSKEEMAAEDRQEVARLGTQALILENLSWRRSVCGR